MEIPLATYMIMEAFFKKATLSRLCYLATYLPSYLPTYLPSYLATYLATYFPGPGPDSRLGRARGPGQRNWARPLALTRAPIRARARARPNRGPGP